MQTRYRRNFDAKGKELPPTPYEVSDEQLQIEADEKTIAELLAMKDEDIKVPQIGRFLKALARLRR